MWRYIKHCYGGAKGITVFCNATQSTLVAINSTLEEYTASICEVGENFILTVEAVRCSEALVATYKTDLRYTSK
jgi:hypothetical protein